MSLFSIFGGGNAPAYPTDTIVAPDGTEVTFTFFKHASLSIRFGERYIYTDPVHQYAEYARLPKADLVLVTHSHYDHLDRAAIDDITTRNSLIICDKTSAEALEGECVAMTPSTIAEPFAGVRIEAVAAYNTTEGHTDFHPAAREDCGYVITLGGGLRIYIAGDTEPTPEMAALRDIDVAFLPVNQPYTMTVDQAIEAVKTFKPRIFYPYHFGQVEERTDIERLVREVEALGTTEIRIRPME